MTIEMGTLWLEPNKCIGVFVRAPGEAFRSTHIIIDQTAEGVITILYDKAEVFRREVRHDTAAK